MQISSAEYGTSLPVDSYGPGFFRIAGEVHQGAVALWAEAFSPWGGLDDLETLEALADKVDLLFVGTGAEIAYLPKAMVRRLEALGIMCEPMPTPSAARTYNVLLSEGRRVGVALLPMPLDEATA